MISPNTDFYGYDGTVYILVTFGLLEVKKSNVLFTMISSRYRQISPHV